MTIGTTDPKKLRAAIRRYEKILRDSKKTYGFYRDGTGVRYRLGPTYLLLGDLDGGLASFEWYEKEFPEDCGEPGHLLCWTLALLRGGKNQPALRKLRNTVLSNVYIVPKLLGLPLQAHDMWHGSSDEEPEYLEEIPDEYLALWSKTELDWLREAYNTDELQSVLKRHIEICRELEIQPRGPRRTALVEEDSRLSE